MSDTLKFVVMSDLHLVREGETSMSLDTAARLEAAVACLITAMPTPISSSSRAILPMRARRKPTSA